MAADARLDIEADDNTAKGWRSALAEAKKNSQKINGLVKGAFAFAGGAAAVAFFKTTAVAAFEYADAIGKASVKSGLTSEAVSQLGYAAGTAGIELADLSKALGTLQINISKTKQGSEQLGDAFEAVGINFGKFRNLRADTQFEVVAEAISRLESSTDQGRAANILFGESGARLLPLFADGAKGIRMLREESDALGKTLGEEQQKKLQATGDAIGRLKTQLSSLLRELVASRAENLTISATWLTNLFKDDPVEKVGDLAKEVNELRESIELLETKSKFQLVIGGRADLTEPGRLEGLKDELAKAEAKLKAERPKFEAIVDPKKAEPAVPPGVLKKGAGFRAPGEFSDEELEQFIAQRQAMRKTESEINEARARDYANQRAVLEDLDQSILEGTAGIFEQNEERIDESLGRVEDDVISQLEVQRSVFEEFGANLEGTLSDAFFNAGQGAESFGETVLKTFKRIIADRAAQQTVELLGSLFKGSGSSAGGGTGGAFASVLGAIFGGARAEGGPVFSGKGYLVGERGPEFFLPRQSGTIIPNGANIGGGRVVNISNVTNIDARGSTKDGAEALMSQLPAILERNNKQLEARISMKINRGQFGLQ